MRKLYFTIFSIFIPILGFTKPIEGDKKTPKAEDTQKATEVKAEDDQKSFHLFGLS